MPTPDTLSDRERTILAIERPTWLYLGAKEQAIRDQLGVGTTRYYQELNTLIEREAALAFDPLLVNRLRRIRARRERTRAARRLDL